MSCLAIPLRIYFLKTAAVTWLQTLGWAVHHYLFICLFSTWAIVIHNDYLQYVWGHLPPQSLLLVISVSHSF